MASSSSSPPSTSILAPRSCTYHAFLSFRGEDTRNGFTGHLYAALDGKGIKTFRDDKELERGEVISVELLKAIEESMFAIIVLSPNYAFSSWCLDELRKIVECSNSWGLSIVPIFYGVEPSDVRYQKGSFGEAFKKHEERFGQNCEKIRRWRDALTEVANHSGWDSKVDKHEATLVECIADHIHKMLIPKLPSSTKNLVGIASRVDEVTRHIGRGLNDVRFIGIWGMGGIGKTTIARAVYEAIQGEFKVSCFLANVREARERNRIVDKQKELADKANISANFYDEYEGQRIIQTFLCNKKVLLVLDDVSDEVELKNLAGDQDWFGPGSRIIITARDIQLLKIYEVHGTYEVQDLVESESFDLFRLKAFKQEKPNEKYLDLIKEVVKYCGGLPLALEVLGSYFCGRSIDVWHDAIKKIKSTPLAKIHDTLKISYDSLDDAEKNIFLDISCFFEGANTSYVTKLLEKCGYNARIGIDILLDRSLVKINEWSNVFEMHDLVQDMGRNIVIAESPNNPGKRSRLWSKGDADFVLQRNNGSEAIQAIVLNDACSRVLWSAEAFSNMTQLKLLIIFSAGGLRDLSCLPTSLKVFRCWYGYPLKTLPLSNEKYELVEISLKYSDIENLWHGKKFLGKLKYLDLSHSYDLKQTPDLSEVPMLQTLLLESCWGLIEVHPSVVHHKSLTLLDLTECRMLKALPGKLRMRSLNELILDDCSGLENLPEFGKCMKSLSRLSLERTSIKKLPTSLPKLKCLKLNFCPRLRCLPELPSSIRELEAWHCHSLDISEFNILSNVCGVFASSSQDPGQVLLEMVISGSEIPSWFVHRQDGNSISIPCDYPRNEKLGIALCFQLTFDEPFRKYKGKPHLKFDMVVRDGNNRFDTNRIMPMSVMVVDDGNNTFDTNRNMPMSAMVVYDGNNTFDTNRNMPMSAMVVRDGNNRFDTNRTMPMSAMVVPDGNCRFNTNRTTPTDKHLYIVCLANDYFGDEFHQGTCFELSILDYVPARVSMTSAARWVNKEDIEDLKKSEIERPKKKKKKV